MDQRTDPFIRKFKSAQGYLQAKNMQDIVSLKYRDDCVSSSEYSHLTDQYLKATLGLAVTRAEGDFWGQAWLVRDEHRNRVILVEHETGLEILYVAGSIASLVALIPLISSGWNRLRDRFSRHEIEPSRRGPVEVRQFSQTDILVEHHSPSVEVYILGAAINDYRLLQQKVRGLETEVANLKKQAARNNRKRNAPPKAKSRKGVAGAA